MSNDSVKVDSREDATQPVHSCLRRPRATGAKPEQVLSAPSIPAPLFAPTVELRNSLAALSQVQFAYDREGTIQKFFRIWRGCSDPNVTMRQTCSDRS